MKFLKEKSFQKGKRMNELYLYVIEILSGTLRMSIPLLLAALGGLFSERSGVINIALEGIMLISAFTTITTTYFLSQTFSYNSFFINLAPWLGVFSGIVVGSLTATLHGFISITVKGEQIVSGLAINILASGITQYLCLIFFQSSSNTPMLSQTIPPFSCWLTKIPLLGLLLFSYSPLVYISLIILVFSHLLLFNTPLGLRIRAVGEHPQAADTLGINVSKIRYIAVIISGALAGLGGAILALESAQFVQNMTAGRGYIALAAMIFGKWTPLGSFLACTIFGFANKLQISIRIIPTQFAQMIPYLTTIIILTGFVGKATPPKEIGKPYEK